MQADELVLHLHIYLSGFETVTSSRPLPAISRHICNLHSVAAVTEDQPIPVKA